MSMELSMPLVILNEYVLQRKAAKLGAVMEWEG